jgi:hypothetical protein
MILTEETTSMLLDGHGVYDCKLITQQFVYKLKGEQTSPLGNIICFESAVTVGQLGMTKALVLVGDILTTNVFGACCFQRLYSAQLGTLLSLYTGKETYLEESSILVEGQQASLVLLNQVKDSIIFHMIFPIEMHSSFSNLGIDNLFLLNLSSQDLADFKTNAVNSFEYLIKNIFIQTRRDNF